jgi:putative ABC transport system permease protein
MNTALFSVIDAVLLRSLPYVQPDRLVMIWKQNLQRNVHLNLVSPTNVTDFQTRARSFSSLGGAQDGNFNLTGAGDPVQLMVQRATSGVLPTLGVQPLLGRFFTAQEDRPDGPRVVILTYSLWSERFGADRSILGRTITLDSQPYTVIGVMPLGFTFLNRQVAAWIPLNLDPAARWKEGNYLRVVARLKPYVSAATAEAEVEAIAAQGAREAPALETGWDFTIQSVRDQVTGGVRQPLLILGAAIGCVLLIACANIGGLLLARGVARGRETAIRVSIGASRSRIASQHFVEALLLAAGGGALGVLLAGWGTRLLVAAIPDALRTATLGEVTVDAGGLGFALLLTLGAGLLCGLAPALTTSIGEPYGMLRGSAGTASRRHGSRIRRAFVVVQTALALTLLSGAGLMARSLMNLYATPVGVDSEGVFTFRTSLPAPDRHGFYAEALQRIGSLPGVISAAAIDNLPLGGQGVGTYFFLDGQPDPPHGSEPIVQLRAITPRYFETLHIPLKAGREFSAHDSATAPRSYIVNEMAAQRFFPNQNPIGQTISIMWDGREPGMVVGVVGDVRYTGIDNDVMPTVYWPHAQHSFGGMNFVIRTAIPPMNAASGVAAELRRMDRNLPLNRVRPLSAYIAIETATSRFVMQLLMLLAGLALILATSGLFGLLSYLVDQRRREIGIRVALGAFPRQVLALVVREGLPLLAIGIACGLALSTLAARLLGTLLHGVTATDPATYAAVVVAVALTSLFAMVAPVRAALGIDPSTALRQE